MPKEPESHDAEPRCQRILFADDLSADAPKVFAHALAIARRAGAELVIAHAADVTEVIAISYMPAESYDQWVNESVASDQGRLRPLLEQAREAGVKAEILSLTGNAAEAVLEAATKKKVDLIVMGFHQRGRLGQFLAGSAALQTLREAPCPVLLAPLPKDSGRRRIFSQRFPFFARTSI